MAQTRSMSKVQVGGNLFPLNSFKKKKKKDGYSLTPHFSKFKTGHLSPDRPP